MKFLNKAPVFGGIFSTGLGISYLCVRCSSWIYNNVG